MSLAVCLCTGSGIIISCTMIVANNHCEVYISDREWYFSISAQHIWLMNVQSLWRNIANILTVLFLVCIYRVYFVALFLLLKILLLLLLKILAWYLEILTILLAVLFAVAYLHGSNLRSIANVLFEL